MKFDFKINVITVLVILLCTHFLYFSLDGCSPWEACGKKLEASISKS